MGACSACGALLIVQEVKPCLCHDCAEWGTILRIPKIWGPAEWRLIPKRSHGAAS